MEQLVWEERFSVGIQEFDEHHKTLFRITNSLLKAQKDGDEDTVIDVILDQLYHYTLYHFTAEESVMEHFSFPELGEHQQEHLELLVKVKAFQKRIKEGQRVTVDEMVDFMAAWLLDHTLGMDQAYGPFLNARGIH